MGPKDNTSAYDLFGYDISTLIEILSEKSGASKETIKSKLHSIYFKNYFDALNAKIIIVENHYVDHDFLYDFAGYYVRCFNEYKRICYRLHFFNFSFEKKDFDLLLSGAPSQITEKNLNDSYLGFVVVKPLPQTIIGRTCLKTYNSDNERRYYPITRNYPVNLFGISLQINSIAYQEQDKVVAACATSALWSVFHGTGMLFQHSILSPVEITETACVNLPLETRFFPNHGLSPAQMAQAIRCLNLEPLLINADNKEVLKSTVYAYLRGEVPILMGIELVDVSNTPEKCMGLHAVAVTGYSLGLHKSIPYKFSGLLMKSSKLDKIYAHDDQVGPFARMTFDDDPKYPPSSMYTSWIGQDKQIGSVRAIPKILLVPLYHKIRIPFSVAQDAVIVFDNFIETIRSAGLLSYKGRIEWDIYLTTCNKFKSTFLHSPAISNNIKYKILVKSMPRYLWHAAAMVNGDPILDLLFDATDIEQGAILNQVICYNDELINVSKDLIQGKSKLNELISEDIWRILEALLK